jgi:hypothetical protein
VNPEPLLFFGAPDRDYVEHFLNVGGFLEGQADSQGLKIERIGRRGGCLIKTIFGVVGRGGDFEIWFRGHIGRSLSDDEAAEIPGRFSPGNFVDMFSCGSVRAPVVTGEYSDVLRWSELRRLSAHAMASAQR